jgi:hypothetical protein
VLDVSAHGLGMTTAAPFSPGLEVEIHIGDSTYLGQVRNRMACGAGYRVGVSCDFAAEAPTLFARERVA